MGRQACPMERSTYRRVIMNRFEKKFIPEPNSGCWLWLDCLNRGGYGVFYNGTKNVLAHRFSYERVHGAIPKGKELDHLCRVPCCVNPDHLEAVTHKENVRRGRAGQVAILRKMERHSCRNGHLFSEDNTYHHPDGSRVCRTCERARKRIFQRAYWVNLTDEQREQRRAYDREYKRRTRAKPIHV